MFVLHANKLRSGNDVD